MKKITLFFLILLMTVCIFLLTGCFSELLLPDAEPFSRETLLAMIEESVLAQEATLTYRCAEASTLESDIDSTLSEAYKHYLVGSNVENILWSLRSAMGNATIDLEFEYKEEFTDERASAVDYSRELLAETVENSVINKTSQISLLFRNDGSLSDELLEEAVNACVFESDSALVNYYVSKAQYTITTYGDYALLSLEPSYYEDTVPYGELTVPRDMRDAVEQLSLQWDTDDNAVLYYPEGAEDPEALARSLISTAMANDADDPYLCPSCEWLVYGEDDILITIDKVHPYDISLRSSMRQEVLAEAESIAMSLSGESPEEKVKEIGRLLADRVKYDHELANEILSDVEMLSDEESINRTAYGALISGTTVCSGYAKAFQLICDYAGIDCWIVDGEVEGDGHEWNVVYMNGTMYYADITFADTGRSGKYLLFGQELYEKEGYVVDEGFYIPAA